MMPPFLIPNLQRLNSGRANGARKKIENYSYGLTDQIGKGYSSIVYKGKNDDTDQVVAIKVIDLKQLKQQVGKKMLQSEITILKQLKHKNLLYCHNVYSTVNNCYIITQYCNQGDLASYLKKKKKLHQNQALNIFRDIFSGFIQLAHKKILHRDLKPANIFLNSGIAKIADFGFAKVANNELQKYNVGTPLYMSPEALKKNFYTIKNDVWGMGVILYEMLIGQTPWQSRSQKELMEKMSRVPVSFRINISEDVKSFIRGCLQADQQKRFSLSEMQNHPMIIRIQENMEPKPLRQSQMMKIFINKENKVESQIQLERKIEKVKAIIISQINLCRFVYKMLGHLKGEIEHPAIQQFLIFKVDALKQLIEGDSKHYQIVYMSYFCKWEGFSKYRLAVQQYWQKYHKAYKAEVTKVDITELQKDVRMLIKNNLDKIKGPFQESIKKKVIAIDFLVSFWQLLQLMMNHWGDLQYFSEHSKVESMAQGKPCQISKQIVMSLLQKIKVLDLQN